MDFNYTEEQTMVGDLARGILEKEMSSDRIKAIERGDEWFDRPLWRTLADAGLLGLAVPEDLGGMGLGYLEVCTLLGEVGRVVAPVPVLPSLVLGAMPVAEYGTAAQKERLLGPLAAGEAVLTAALVDAESGIAGQPATVAHGEGEEWVLTGTKLDVPAADFAACILVPAAISDGVGIFLIDPSTPGVTVTPSRTSRGETLCTVALDGVRVGRQELLGGEVQSDTEWIDWLYERAIVATAAMQLGVSDKALEITAGYVRERHQFGVPLGTFQAVQHRCADGYMDLQSMRWATWRAAWVLSEGRPAFREATVAKFWAAEGGARIAASAQHLHAGMGVDLDYPIHRYFLWSKALELSLGAATPQLVRLGREMATNLPPQVLGAV